MFRAFLGLGSNLGDRQGHLRAGLHRVRERIGGLTRVSGVYETEPWGVENQDSYYNLAVEVSTPLLPLRLLHTIREIESECGRERKERWGSRTLDIDLLFFEDYHFTLPELTVPHPRLTERNFVLHPLAEIAPDFIHPVRRLALAELKEKCPDTGWINRNMDADITCS